MKKLLFILFAIACFASHAQVTLSKTDERRKATREEVKILEHLADSFFNELKTLYKLEVKENSPRKYQPERIALVRSYLLLFQHMETSSEIVAYDKSDITQIFGKPDTIITKVGATHKEMQWLYGDLQRKYVRINNLRYRFFYVNDKLQSVKRDDQ
jgi:hypothetical protein